MNSQLTSNAEALRLFFTDDIYLVEDKNQMSSVEPVTVAEAPAPEIVVMPTINIQYQNQPEKPTLVEEPMPIIQKELALNF